MPQVREVGKGWVCHKDGEGIKGLSPDAGRGADAVRKGRKGHFEIRNSPRSCGPDAGRGRNTIRVEFGNSALLRPALAGLRRVLAALRRV